MKKRKYAVCAGSILALCGLLAISGISLRSDEPSNMATEMLSRPTDNSVTLSALADVDLLIKVEYSTTPTIYSPAPTIPANPAMFPGGKPIQLVITGLQPDTQYYYRMLYSEDGGLSWTARDAHSFHTRRAAGSPFAFTITSDSHVNVLLGNAATWQQTMTNVANDHPDFVIDCGDTFAMDNTTTASGAEHCPT
jgi:phosphodiesterase/alkaline phosphatase D-like protein